jgi:hypothetical protein
MNFAVTRIEWDRKTQRAYVELQSNDPDGGNAFAVASFAYKGTAASKAQRTDDITRKARHILKRAGIAV